MNDLKKISKICSLIVLVSFLMAGNIYADENSETQFHDSHSCMKCDLTGTVFTKDTVYNNSILEDARLIYSSFQSAKFNGSNFVNAYLTKSEAVYSEFRGCDFTSAHFNSAYFVLSEFSGSKFIKSNLKNANFSNSNLSSVDFTGAIVDGADFSRAVLIGSNLSLEQMATVKSLNCAVLPGGELSKCVSNL